MASNLRMVNSAIVIGGGVAGLLTAQALSESYAQVTIVERDHFGQAPGNRAGVPQDKHVHTLWAGGMQAIELLLPDFEAELIGAGGQPLGFWGDFHWLLAVGRWLPKWPSTQHLVSCGRTLLEYTIRRRVQENSRVHFLDGHEVTGLRLDPTGAVSGVDLVRRGQGNESSSLEAALVVDAAGRRSGLAGWLGAAGLPQPADSIVDPSIGYATRLVTLPGTLSHKGLYVQLAPPDHTRGGIMFPVEDGKWVVTLLGACADYPPTDDSGFLEFAQSLRHREFFDTIKDSEPASPTWGYRHTANHRRHYERLRTMPRGLLVVGDSLCAFNPIYGQGMTVAALQAVALRALLNGQPQLPRKAQKRMAGIASQAWMISASEDLRYPVTGGPSFGIRLLHGYLDKVFLAGTVDEAVANTFLRVLNMLDKPSSLQRPLTVLRVFRGARRARL